MRFCYSILLVFLLNIALSACTTAIISGKYTKDGRPILWKHRDAGSYQNVLIYFDNTPYSFTGLVNAKDTENLQVWAGTNSAGFSIMNSASYNLKPVDDATQIEDREGIIMKLALQHCATLEDFETLLDTIQKPIGVEANFGVIDAQGGAAYYETDNFGYTKFDANDPRIAPFGYIIRSNYSFTGEDIDDAYGYIRYKTAYDLFYTQFATEEGITPEFIIQEVTRCLDHSLTGINLDEQWDVHAGREQYFPLQDYIVRYSSVSSVVVHGVLIGGDPELTTMYTVLGFPLSSVVIPTWVAAGNQLPKIAKRNDSGVSSLCNASLELKKKLFPISRGSGDTYMNIDPLFYGFNKQNGMLEVVKARDKDILEKTAAINKGFEQKGFSKEIVLDFYKFIDEYTNEIYKTYFNLNLQE